MVNRKGRGVVAVLQFTKKIVRYGSFGTGMRPRFLDGRFKCRVFDFDRAGCQVTGPGNSDFSFHAAIIRGWPPLAYYDFWNGLLG